jgi:hypothetical protein
MDALIKFLGNLQWYFNDFIGAVAPGIILVVGLMMVGAWQPPEALMKAWGVYFWLVGMVGFFAIGHALLSISEVLRWIVPASLGFALWKLVHHRTETDAAFLALRAFLKKREIMPGAEELPFMSARNIAMTLSADGEEIGRRFRFLSSFCYGTATAVLLIGFTSLGLHIAQNTLDGATVWQVIACAIVWWLLVRRGAEFEVRTLTAPFGTALAEIIAAEIGIKTAGGKPATAPTSGGSAAVVTGAPATPDVFPS